MTTNNAVNVGLSGSTGSGKFVGDTSPTISGATLSGSTVLGTPASGTLTNCTALPASAGTTCTATNDNASAGQLGEYISSTVLVGSSISLSNATAKTITSISLTAGDWEVSGSASTNNSGSATSSFFAGISTTDNTLPDAAYCWNAGGSATLGTEAGGAVATIRASLSGTTTYYLVGRATFSSGTQSGCGHIHARRVR